MKKIFYLFLAIFTFLSCAEDEIVYNDAAVQALKNYEPWKATTFKAVVNSTNSVKLTASDSKEELTLNVASKNVGTYPLGTSSANTVIFKEVTETATTFYTTGGDWGSGEIKITKNDTSKRTITGSFYYTATSLAGKSLTMEYGVFYNVPY